MKSEGSTESVHEAAWRCLARKLTAAVHRYDWCGKVAPPCSVFAQHKQMQLLLIHLQRGILPRCWGCVVIYRKLWISPARPRGVEPRARTDSRPLEILPRHTDARSPLTMLCRCACVMGTSSSPKRLLCQRKQNKKRSSVFFSCAHTNATRGYALDRNRA